MLVSIQINRFLDMLPLQERTYIHKSYIIRVSRPRVPGSRPPPPPHRQGDLDFWCYYQSLFYEKSRDLFVHWGKNPIYPHSRLISVVIGNRPPLFTYGPMPMGWAWRRLHRTACMHRLADGGVAWEVRLESLPPPRVLTYGLKIGNPERMDRCRRWRCGAGGFPGCLALSQANRY